MENKDIDAAFKSLGAELIEKTLAKQKIAAQELLLESQPPEIIVEKVKNGAMLPPSQCLTGWNNLKLKQSLFEAGLLNSIVSFLNEGAHSEFQIDDKLKNSLVVNREGERKFEQISPKFWLAALCRSIADEHSLNEEICDKLCVEISCSIRPYVQCMCDDTARKLFKSNKYYHESLSLFFDLILRLAAYSTEAAEVLLGYDDLLDVIVQCLFWRTHRPDIMRELHSRSSLSELGVIEARARCVIDSFTMCSTIFVDGQDKHYDDRAKKFFKAIATTPVVSNAFDPDNDGIFLSNIATLMKTDSFHKLTEINQEFYYDILLRSSHAGYIDKHVISSVIDLFASVRRCDVAIRVVDMSFNLLCKRTGEWIGDKKDQPIVTENDERFAVAIDAGMVESLLRMLTRFVGQRQYPELRETIYNLLDSVHIVVATRKRRSTRALDSNRGLIEEALLTHERILTGSKDRCILKIVETILSVNRLDSCSQCFEQLEKKDVRRCSRCMIAKYCSRECQVEDWKSGPHKDFCNAAVENARQIKSDGGTDEDVRLKNSILHIKMRGDEIFMKNSVTAVFQAISKGYEILDCIVDVDLRVSPPSIEVMLSEEFLSLDMNKESEMYAVKKMKVDEAREEKCLPFNYIGDEAGMIVLHKQPASSAFPGCVSNLGPSWPNAQETMKQFFCLKGSDDIARMTESVPGLMDEFLEQLFAKRYLREDGSKEGMTKVLKEPTDEDEFMSILGEVLSAMNLAE
ncbi:hypothetical protein QTG54_003759 [Skeletonema marinoi]|uniref:MYND-type domain-containing protein n=1 Tax=Skeletonema marinoi TaxID=267567 RepID=A0AAD8YIS3_9STRA|nr:hypothetical protein QTG54_003759 [Skeletonema marinoi]